MVSVVFSGTIREESLVGVSLLFRWGWHIDI